MMGHILLPAGSPVQKAVLNFSAVNESTFNPDNALSDALVQTLMPTNKHKTQLTQVSLTNTTFSTAMPATAVASCRHSQLT